HPSLSARRVDRFPRQPLPALQRGDPLVRQHPHPQLPDPRRALPQLPRAHLPALPAGRAGERAVLPGPLHQYGRDDRICSARAADLDDDRADLHRRGDPDPARRDRSAGHRDRTRRRSAGARHAVSDADPQLLDPRRSPRRALRRLGSRGDHRRLLARAPRGRDGTGRREDAGDDRRDARLARDSRRAAACIRRRRNHRRSPRAAQRPRHAAAAPLRRVPRPRVFGRALLWPYTFGMVSLAHAPLTRIGFRRDVRLFLICLVGFLVVLIFSLLLLLRTDLTRTEETIDFSRFVIADVSADAINHTRRDAQALETQLIFLRGRFNVAQIELDARDGRRIVSGDRPGSVDEVTRLTGAGTLRLRFAGADRVDAQRRFWIISGISIAATSLGAMLLLLYLPRITRPIEEMLGDAKELGERSGDQEETTYLIETFRNSIATLKAQELELKHLHDREKTRADDLERVT